MRARRALAATAVAILATACSADTDPPPTPAPTTSAAPSATTSTPTETTEPAPTPPPLPPDAANPDAVGAAAFVRYWFDLANYAYATGDTEPLMAASEADCETCSNVVKTVREQYSGGGALEGGIITVLSAEAAPPSDSGVALVSTRYEQGEIRSMSSDGTVIETTPAAPGATVGFIAAFVNGAWVAAGIGT